ncbi:DinB family protein [Agriterribacter sp.]|uniref:DinB family protein n=1 Tax=Agriterribacter sp. TaxID=2821509 RepID=UPI002CC29790|nr:DinB family protein [Agriterribacter sp.]HRO47647.1 DinB family protein [Agriterribacter sp.]HRQ17630.1 DinB family protein [Agriterribacter sp.]
METKTVSSRMFSIVVLYDMQTTFFENATEGIADEDRHKRLNTKANHIAWLTGSLVEQRYEIANLFGAGLEQSAHELFKDNKGIQDDITYPSLAVFKKDWENITPVLRDILMKVDDEKLDTLFEMMPGMKMTHYDLIAFCTYREANCIGQIALWRRLLGYPAMKYN